MAIKTFFAGGKILVFAGVATVLFALSPEGSAQTAAYSNLTTFTGNAATNGGAAAAGGSTILVADDLMYSLAYAGATVTQVQFTIANLNSAATGINPTIFIYDSDGPNGGPGTILRGLSFNTITVNGSSVQAFTYATNASTQFTLPSSGTIWAGIFFTGTSSSETAAAIDEFGQGLFNPPTVGSSLDRAFYSSSAAPGTSDPAGSIATSPYGGSPPANFGWTITVPEPSTCACFGLALTGLAVVYRGRRQRA